jgi:hypothetical protein
MAQHQTGSNLPGAHFRSTRGLRRKMQVAFKRERFEK